MHVLVYISHLNKHGNSANQGAPCDTSGQSKNVQRSGNSEFKNIINKIAHEIKDITKAIVSIDKVHRIHIIMTRRSGKIQLQ